MTDGMQANCPDPLGELLPDLDFLELLDANAEDQDGRLPVRYRAGVGWERNPNHRFASLCVNEVERRRRQRAVAAYVRAQRRRSSQRAA